MYLVPSSTKYTSLSLQPLLKGFTNNNKRKLKHQFVKTLNHIEEGATVVEMLEVIDYDENYKPLEIETIDIIKPESLKGITEYKHQSGPALPGEPGRSHSATSSWRKTNSQIKIIQPKNEDDHTSERRNRT